MLSQTKNMCFMKFFSVFGIRKEKEEKMRKKIDFHIHTIPFQKGKDEDFSYSADWLEDYIGQAKLNAIAITNHNLFDAENFKNVTSLCGKKNVAVFPGMEIDLKSGHVNLIYPAEQKYIDELVNCSTKMAGLDKNDSIDLNFFLENFTSYADSIMTFETGKSNTLKKPDQLKDAVFTAGVSNSLKFQKMWNQEFDTVPVLFSDAHATKNGNDLSRSDIPQLAHKNTFIQSDSNSFEDIRNALKYKKNVNIFEDEIHDSFEIDGVRVSKGLNLIIGRRGSGKTVFIDKIQHIYQDEVYRISQFESTKREKFLNSEKVNSGNEAIKDWQNSNRIQLEAVQDTIKNNVVEIPETFFKELNRYAEDIVKSKSKQSYKIFEQQNYAIDNIEWYGNVLNRIKELIYTQQLWTTLDNVKYNKISLINLYTKVRNQYNDLFIQNEKRKYINHILDIAKDVVSNQTGKTKLPSFDFTSMMRQRILINAANTWISAIEPTKIRTKKLMDYKIVTSVRPHSGAREVQQSLSLGTSEKVSDAYEYYEKKDYINYLNILKSRGLLKYSQIIDALLMRETKLLTLDDEEASGGQLVSLALTLSLNKSSTKNVILIDEPEASLDNPFIKNNLVKKLQDLSKERVVFVITHNSTLGALLTPDYLIVAKKDSEGQHIILSGEYSSKKLNDNSSHFVTKSYDDFIDSMEAGFNTFEMKGSNYNELKNF